MIAREFKITAFNLISSVFNFLFRAAPSNTSTVGKRAEQIALKFLKKRGMRLLARNLKNQFGEIDLILKQDETIVFVEVRSRSSVSQGDPAETITYPKQKKLSRAALAFLKSNQLLNHSARFDVIALIWQEENRSPEIRHLINAFEVIE